MTRQSHRQTLALTMASITNRVHDLEIVSCNMHGFYQGHTVVNDMINSNSTDVFLLQEHWLTPSNLSLFDSNFPGYFSYGSSAMSKHLENGMLCGRPFDGVMILIKYKTKLESVSLSCKSHRSKTANIKILSANSKHRS